MWFHRLWRTEALCYTSGGLVRWLEHRMQTIIDEGDSMPRGREKDRKTRKKHRKNVARVKALAKTRRAAAKKVKRG